MGSGVIICPVCHEPTMAHQCAPGVKTELVLGLGSTRVEAGMTLDVRRPEGLVCRRCLGMIFAAIAPDLIESLTGEKDIDRVQFRIHHDGDEEEGGHA